VKQYYIYERAVYSTRHTVGEPPDFELFQLI